MHVVEIYTKKIFRRFQIKILNSLKQNIQKISEFLTPDIKGYFMYWTKASRTTKDFIRL